VMVLEGGGGALFRRVPCSVARPWVWWPLLGRGMASCFGNGAERGGVSASVVLTEGRVGGGEMMMMSGCGDGSERAARALLSGAD
jgi:hypothetical protein